MSNPGNQPLRGPLKSSLSHIISYLNRGLSHDSGPQQMRSYGHPPLKSLGWAAQSWSQKLGRKQKTSKNILGFLMGFLKMEPPQKHMVFNTKLLTADWRIWGYHPASLPMLLFPRKKPMQK